MPYIPQSDSQQVLKDILARDPRASIHQIRRAHPAFRAVSLDHLSLRLSQALDSLAHENAAP